MKIEDCRFGQVVHDPHHGLGMIEARVANTNTVNVSYEHGGVNQGAGGLTLVGHISWVEEFREFFLWYREHGRTAETDIPPNIAAQCKVLEGKKF